MCALIYACLHYILYCSYHLSEIFYGYNYKVNFTDVIKDFDIDFMSDCE